jgi:hypothetical protein
MWGVRQWLGLSGSLLLKVLVNNGKHVYQLIVWEIHWLISSAIIILIIITITIYKVHHTKLNLSGSFYPSNSKDIPEVSRSQEACLSGWYKCRSDTEPCSQFT